MLINTLLIEIGTEDLPTKKLPFIFKLFKKTLLLELTKLNIGYNNNLIHEFVTSRRIAIKIIEINEKQHDSITVIKGPSLTKSFDENGKQTKTSICWCKKYNININKTNILDTKKGKWLTYKVINRGKKTEFLLKKIITSTIKNILFYINRTMTWGLGTIEFIRPIKNITIILDNKIIFTNILGIRSKNITFGHFSKKNNLIYIKNVNDYPKILWKQGLVVANYKLRKKIIMRKIKKIEKATKGCVLYSTILIKEAIYEVEYPAVYLGKFNKIFLKIPKEILLYIIIKNNKLVPIFKNNKYDEILPYFIIITNTISKNYTKIISDIEKTINIHLNDVIFFYYQDQKKKFKELINNLRKILFHKYLGNLQEKNIRVKCLSIWIAKIMKLNIKTVSRAGILSKCDLATNLVHEFTEIKGIVGMCYAIKNKEDKIVSLAQKEQYMPKYSKDELPSNKISCSLSIADKIDNLTGFLGINFFPTGNNDPYGLKKYATGIIRILIEKKISLNLTSLIEQSIKLYNKKILNPNIQHDLINFIYNKLFIWYKKQNYEIRIIQSVLNTQPICLWDFDKKIKAITEFSQNKKKYNLLIQTNKRINNILNNNINNQNILMQNNKIIISLLKKSNEINLVKYLHITKKKIYFLLQHKEYKNILFELCNISLQLKFFLKKIKILTEDFEIRTNRLNILLKIKKLFTLITDISEL